MEKLRHFGSNVGTKNSFDKRPNNFQTIPKSDIKGKMLRPQFKQGKFAAEHLLKFEFGNLGKRSKTFKTFNTFGTLATFQDVSEVTDVPPHIYMSLFRR